MDTEINLDSLTSQTSDEPISLDEIRYSVKKHGLKINHQELLAFKPIST